jgi:hypothetical protein
MVIRLLQFEAFAERVLQDAIARRLSGRLQLHDLAVQVTRALEDGQVIGPRGESQAPDRYTVWLHPDDLAALQAERAALEAGLRATIIALARQAGLWLATDPTVAVVARAEQPLHSVGIRADIAAEALGATMSFDADQRARLADAIRAPAGYLVVDGRRVVPLERAVTRLGRQADNDLVLDDATVSRHHAQIRRRYGRYVLYDLGSRSGTFVNGARIREVALAPGDVISLARCDLIYGEEERPAASEREDTQMLPGDLLPPHRPEGSPPHE